MDTAQEILADIGLSDSEVARRINASQPTVWRIRTGETKDCSASVYMDLVKLRNDFAQKPGTRKTAKKTA